MTEYRAAWLDLIASRDNFYLLVMLATAATATWYKLAAGRLFGVWLAVGAGIVAALLAWGLLL